jgi:glycosyltransferase involved in cell wall biosynthesis
MAPLHDADISGLTATAVPRRVAVRKIVFVLHSHAAGGAERHLLQLMQALAAAGIECVYAGPRDGWLADQLTVAGLRCVPIRFCGLFDLRSLLQLMWLVAREQPDLLHAHLTRGAFYGGLASRLTGVPNVATAHSTNAGRRFGMAGRIIAVSDAVHTFLSARGYARDVLRTVRHGIPDAASLPRRANEAVRAACGLEHGPVLTMAARFTPAKGQDLALRALAQVGDQEWTLVLAGATDNAYATQMRQLAQALGIAHRVRFVGHRDDLADIYGCTDIVLAPSRREALSLTLLEAASFGIPVVASDVGGIGEAVEHAVTGILVPSEDVELLAQQIRRLLQDGQLRKEMGAAARERYERLFNLDAMLRATTQVYEELLAGSKP